MFSCKQLKSGTALGFVQHLHGCFFWVTSNRSDSPASWHPNHGVSCNRSSQSTTYVDALETESPKACLLPPWRSTHVLFRTLIWTRAAYEITSWLQFGNNRNRGLEGKSRCQQKNRKQILLGPMFCGAIHTDAILCGDCGSITTSSGFMLCSQQTEVIIPLVLGELYFLNVCKSVLVFSSLLKASSCRPISSIDPQLRRLIKLPVRAAQNVHWNTFESLISICC